MTVLVLVRLLWVWGLTGGWGWEYFFLKNIGLNYSVSSTYASLTGGSLKYIKTPPGGGVELFR